MLYPFFIQAESGVYIIKFVVYARSTDEAFDEALRNLAMWPDLTSDGNVRMSATPERGNHGREETLGH